MPRRYGIIGTIFFFFKRQEGFKTLIYNSINQISFQKSINQKKEKTHRYPWYVLDAYRKSLMLKMSKKLSVVPVSLVTLLNKIKKHRLSFTLSECTLIEDIEIFSIHHHKRISDWGEGAKLLKCLCKDPYWKTCTMGAPGKYQEPVWYLTFFYK
jgi:hypothetical protein